MPAATTNNVSLMNPYERVCSALTHVACEVQISFGFAHRESIIDSLARLVVLLITILIDIFHRRVDEREWGGSLGQV